MRSNRNRFTTGWPIAALAALACSPAFAFNVYKVDPYCPDPTAYTTIQDAVDAAANNPGADYVWISTNAENGNYTHQHIVVNDPDDVIIEGGFFDCTDFDPGSDLTTISGGNADGGPVFDVIGTGHNVYLGNLFITGANRGSGDNGGGINFTGYGELDIAASWVFNNYAGYGAGINVSASGGSAVLRLRQDAIVYENTAYVSGGGIRLEGNARLLVIDPRVAINGNTAAGYGGGIVISGPARADIASAVRGFGDGVVAANYAANGGGIAVIDNGNGKAVLRVFADGSHLPSAIVENRATSNGGGIYLYGDAKACVSAPYLHDNIAEDGAAIFYEDPAAGTSNAQNAAGIYISEQTGYSCGPDLESDLGGTTACIASDSHCNLVSGNLTRHADSTPSSGATFRAHGGDFDMNHVRVQDNIAGSLMLLDDTRSIYIVRCLITDNSASGALVIASPNLTGSTVGCTIANNTLGERFVFSLQGSQDFEFEDDLIYQPGKLAVDPATSSNFAVLSAVSMLVNESNNLPPGNPTVVEGTPTFVDAANRDYHLRGDSLGIDFAPADNIVYAELYSDLDGLQVVDLPQVPNFTGPRDVGVYERQFHCALDEVFCNGFEGV